MPCNPYFWNMKSVSGLVYNSLNNFKTVHKTLRGRQLQQFSQHNEHSCLIYLIRRYKILIFQQALLDPNFSCGLVEGEVQRSFIQLIVVQSKRGTLTTQTRFSLNKEVVFYVFRTIGALIHQAFLYIKINNIKIFTSTCYFTCKPTVS